MEEVYEYLNHWFGKEGKRVQIVQVTTDYMILEVAQPSDPLNLLPFGIFRAARECHLYIITRPLQVEAKEGGEEVQLEANATAETQSDIMHSDTVLVGSLLTHLTILALQLQECGWELRLEEDTATLSATAVRWPPQDKPTTATTELSETSTFMEATALSSDTPAIVISRGNPMCSSSTTYSRDTVYNHLVQKFPAGKKLGSSGWMIYDIWDNSTSFPFSDYRAKLGLKVSSRSYSEALNHPRLPTRSRPRQLPPSNDADLSFFDNNSVESTEANNKEITLQTPRKSRTARARAALTVDIERHFSSLTAIEDLLQTPVGIQEINRPWTLWVGGVFSYFRSFPCTDGLHNARAV
jgi:hypothetical protein